MIGGILGLLIIIILLIQLPAVQTKITQEVAGRFSKQWGTEVSIGKVNINFFETASLQDVYIEDLSGDTLLWADYVKADIGAFALMGQRLELDQVLLEDAYINLYRYEDSTRFNYEFIVESFTSAPTPADTTPSNFVFDLHEVLLKDVRLRFADDSADMKLLVKAPYLLAELETLGLDEQHIVASNIDIRELSGYFRQFTPATDLGVDVPDSLATAPAIAAELDSALLNPSGFRISVQDFTVKDSRFHYQATEELEKGSINFENLDLVNINIGVDKFYLAGDTLRGSLTRLSAIDQNSGFTLINTALDVAVELPTVSATLHEFITPNTRIEDDIRIEQFSLQPGNDMLANLQLYADVEDAILGMQDVAYFLPAMMDTLPTLRNLTATLDLEAKVEDNKAVIEPLRLETADGGLFLYATAVATGLNNLNTMRFDVDVQELTTTVDYLEEFGFFPALPPAAQQGGKLHLIAEAEGTLDNVDVAARLRSGVGTLETNLLFRAPTASQFLVAGNLELKDFDLRPFVGDSLGLGEITLSSKVRVDGNGDQLDIQKFAVLVKELEYNGYTYEGLAAEGFFVDSTLEVAAAYEDPYLVFDLLLASDLKDSIPLVKAELDLEKLNLYRLNFSPDSIIVSTEMVAEIQGQELDDIEGIVKLENTEFIRGAKSYTMDSLVLTSVSAPDGPRRISLVTDFLAAELTGKYLFADIPLAIDQCVSYYCSAYKPTGDMVDYGQDIELNLKMWDEPAIAKAFLPQLELLAPLKINARLRDAERAFELEVVAPGISWDSIVVKDLVAEATTIDRVMSFDVAADKIIVGELVDIPQFGLEGQWAKDSLHFGLALAPPTDSTHLLLGGSLTFNADTMALALDRTQLAIKGQDYELANDAVIKYAPDYLYINNLALQQGEQLLALDTERENTANPVLVALIDQFQISDFMDIMGMEEYGLAATLDGRVELIQPMNLSAIEAELMVQHLAVDSTLIGDIKIDLEKVSDNGRVVANIALDGPGNEALIEGYLNMEDSTNAMAIDVDIAALSLAPLEPFLDDFITDIDGKLQAELDITGSLNEPQIDGRVNFSENSMFRLALTGARYEVENDDYIDIDNEAIRFDNFTLYDSLQQNLVVDGEIFHENLLDYRLSLDLDAEDFQLVNKPQDLDGLFYGTLFLSADAQIVGPIDDVVVRGELEVGEETDFAVVIQTEDANATTASFVNFVNYNAYLENDTTALPNPLLDTLNEVASVNYFTLNASVEVPPTATFTVVVDPNTGDFMTVQGTADLQVYMAPTGDLNLQGVYEVVDGRYRLSFMEVIQKSFIFEEGSTVIFNGDPFNAELDLTAVYTTEASRLPLLPGEEPGSAAYAAAKRKEPVNVLLNMGGTLLDPTFSFDIIVPESEYGSFSSVVAQRLDEIKSDETMLFRQVFGLIVLNKFITENPLEGGGGSGGPGGAVAAKIDKGLSEFLSEQLNSITQDYLGVEVEIDVESSGPGQTALSNKDVGFSLSRSLFSDRVEIHVGGTTSVGTSAAPAAGGGAEGSQFAGNFLILYHINEKGNLNLKIFQRNERDLLTNELLPTSGVALSYFKHFNTLEGLFGDEPKRYEMLKSDGAVKTEL